MKIGDTVYWVERTYGMRWKIGSGTLVSFDKETACIWIPPQGNQMPSIEFMKTNGHTFFNDYDEARKEEDRLNDMM